MHAPLSPHHCGCQEEVKHTLPHPHPSPVEKETGESQTNTDRDYLWPAWSMKLAHEREGGTCLPGLVRGS